MRGMAGEVSQTGHTLIREPPKIASGPGLTLEAA